MSEHTVKNKILIIITFRWENIFTKKYPLAIVSVLIIIRKEKEKKRHHASAITRLDGKEIDWP